MNAIVAARPLLNRPMLESDIMAVVKNPWASELRRLVRTYRAAGLPVLNGSFAFSNIAEGNAQMLTCIPYRLWEYASLFLVLDGVAPGRRRFLDVGGAGSPLPFFLAELGFAGEAIDLQPMLVAVCNHVSTARKLPLQAAVSDVRKPADDLAEPFDLVTCISVLEHIPADAHRSFFEGIQHRLKPGGIFYLTFDYGDYAEQDPYVSEQGATTHQARSIDNLEMLANLLEQCGFRFLGNDPRLLDGAIRRLTTSPSAREIHFRYTLNREVIDADTPWSMIAKYVAKRLLRIDRSHDSRFNHHNFFRLFLEKPR